MRVVMSVFQLGKILLLSVETVALLLRFFATLSPRLAKADGTPRL
jgi:hypothetical protein